MKNIGIVGLGLMGGSLAKSFSNIEDVDKIVAYDNDKKTLIKAKEEGNISDYTYEIDENFSDLDFIFICTPVDTIYDYVYKLKPIISKNCIVTDIGSTKKQIVKKVDELDINFVGSHPMIGSEKTGYEFSCNNLFKNSYYIITKTNNTKTKNISKLKKFVKQLGVIPLEMELDKHDFSVGAVSHVPHIVASALVNLVEKLDDENEYMKTIAAGGFKDITRIASANPYMWEKVCIQNKEEIIKILCEFEDIINEFKENINNSNEIFKYFENAKKYRDSLSTHKVKYINIETKDEVGILSNITTLLSKNNINIKNVKLQRTEEKSEVIINLLFENEKLREKSAEILKENNYKVL